MNHAISPTCLLRRLIEALNNGLLTVIKTEKGGFRVKPKPPFLFWRKYTTFSSVVMRSCWHRRHDHATPYRIRSLKNL